MSAHVTVKGIVGNKPQIREFDTSKKARFSVASSNLSKGQPVTTWYNVEAWNGNTDLIMERIQKGQLVEVSGKLRLSIYQSQKNNNHVIDATIILDNFRILPKEEGRTVKDLTA